MSGVTAHEEYCHPPKGGRQDIAFSIRQGGKWRWTRVNVCTEWLAREASIIDLKNLAIAQIQGATP